MEVQQPSPSSIVILAYDASRDHNEHEFSTPINDVLTRDNINVLRSGDTLLVLGVLHSVQHPMGYHTKVYTDSLFGVDAWAIEEEVAKKVDLFASMLMKSALQCQEKGVYVRAKITAGISVKEVILQEAISCNATWVLLDRQLKKDLRFYIKQIPCKVGLIQDSLSMEVQKHNVSANVDISEQKLFYSLCKLIQPSRAQENFNNEQSMVGRNYSASSSSIGTSSFHKCDKSSSSTFTASSSTEFSPFSVENVRLGSTGLQMYPYLSKSHETRPVLCLGCGLRTIMYIKEAMTFRYSEILAATSEFMKDNLLGEGGYGFVYKGRLKDGQLIAAKVWKEASAQGYTEFVSEVFVLSFARHRNIVMLLGYCCDMNQRILVYEFICNKSLEWHLFSKSASALDWHKRWTIAIGIAKGLRFLHEECRGGPIIHRDLRPSNILLTHDFVPMLCDFGLARWKSGDDIIYTRVRGTLGYLAPEYVENGIVSVQTDVYAFGIVLLQLISGRKIFEPQREEHHQSLKQWAEPLIVKLALHELIDPHLGESYNMYELYNLSRAAYLCIRESPEMRPSMNEVVRLIEGDHVRANDLAQQFLPHFTKMIR